MRKSKLSTGSLKAIVLKYINETHLCTASLLVRIKEFAIEGKKWYHLLLFAPLNSFVYKYYLLDLVDVKVPPAVCQQLSCYFSDS